MALALRAAAHLKPEIGLSQAYNNFFNVLHESQRPSFKAPGKQNLPTPKDVADLAWEVDRLVNWKSADRLGSRLDPFLSNLQKLVAIADLIVGGSQYEPAIAIWGAVRFTLLLACSAKDILEKLSQLLLEVFHECPLHENIAQLYPSSKDLKNASREYLIAVFELLTRFMQYFNDWKGGKVSVALKGFDKTFGPFAAALKLRAKNMKKQLTLASHQTQIEIKKTTDKLFWMQRQQEEIARAEARQRFLQACSSYQPSGGRRHTRSKGIPAWIFQRPEYMEWKDSLSSSPFWCTGIIGSGKSVLAASVVDELGRSDPAAAVGSFFCRFDDPRSLKYREILGNIAKQLFKAANYPSDEVITDYDPTSLNQTDIEHLLDLLPRRQSPYYVLIDGLDDCSYDTCTELALELSRLLANPCFVIRVYLSSRPDLPIRVRSIVRPGFQVSMKEGSEDLRSYIEGEIKRHIMTGDWPVADSSRTLEIQDKLMNIGQGMFLLVKYQLETISRTATEAEALNVLSQLPRRLPEIYDQVLWKLHSASKTDLRKKLFELVLAAKRPLHLDELSEALSIVPGRTEWVLDRVVRDVQKALLYGGSLLDVDEEMRTVHFAHPTVKEHFVSSLSTNLREYLINPRTADIRMGEICVTFLCFDKFDTRLIKSTQPTFNENSIDLSAITGSNVNHSKFGSAIMRLRHGRQDVQTFDLATQLYKVLSPPSKVVFEDNSLLLTLRNTG